ncbi:MAG: nicotinamide-nucleotide amidohydrolase family protein [Ruminococcus sp.]|nr:nicotinamide-nucleotide amidohydrolase family protein [Ruminococcus sp.]
MKNSDLNIGKTGQHAKVTFENLDKLVRDVVQLFLDKGITIATAESCTGGLLSELITSVPGASQIFEIGVCTYSNKIKHEYLGVPKALFKQYGAVSRQVALAMVDGLQKQSGADICISVTGIAGPGGGSPEKPVGTVFVGISCGRKRIVKLLKLWELEDKSRDNIRMNVAYRIFEFLGQMVTAMPDNLPDSKMHESSGKIVLKKFIPWRGDDTSQIVRKVVFLGSVIIFTVCLFLIVDYYWGNYKNKKLGQDMQNLYSQAETVPVITEALEGVQETTEKVWVLKDGAKALLERNSDVVGYINIPDTVISYPVVQRRQEDGNDYYIDKNIDKQDADAGSIFLDHRNNFDYVVDGTKVYENSENLVIYGHEMKDDSMFGTLKYYKDIDGYYSEHPVIELSSNYESYKYKIFAYFIVDAEDETDTSFDCWNTLDFENEEQFYDYVNNAKKRSFDFNDVDVRYGDQLLTLQTCHSMFSSARFYVMARLVRDGEDPYEGTDNVRENDNILWPTVYYEWNENNYDPDAEFESYPLTTD